MLALLAALSRVSGLLTIGLLLLKLLIAHARPVLRTGPSCRWRRLIIIVIRVTAVVLRLLVVRLEASLARVFACAPVRFASTTECASAVPVRTVYMRAFCQYDPRSLIPCCRW
jgi:hypothetical protein